MTFNRWLYLIALSLIWGSSFILMKKGLESFSAFQVAALRLLFASLFLITIGWQYIRHATRKEIWYCFLVGLFGNGIPAFLFTTAQTHISSALAGMLNSLTPIFALLIGIIFFKTFFSRYQITGVLCGLAGAFLLLWNNEKEVWHSSSSLYGGLVVVATLCYAISVNLTKHYLATLHPLSISTLAIGMMAIPSLAYLLHSIKIDTLADSAHLKSLLFIMLLGTGGSGIALVIFNHLVRNSPVVFASSVTYLIPIVAILWGLADGEKITLLQFAGMALILLAVMLVGIKIFPSHKTIPAEDP